MKIIFLDLYPTNSFRISKDQNGGYGTGNNYGKSIFTKFLNILVNRSIEFPPLFLVQCMGELKKFGHDLEYSKEIPKDLTNYDLYILASSIVSFETDIEAIKLISKSVKNVIAIGPFASSNHSEYIKAGAKVIKGEPEMFFFHFKKFEKNLDNLHDLIENFPQVDINELSTPAWDIIFKSYTPKMKFLGTGPAVNINASRGCPYSCFYYCVYPLQQGRKLRLKDPKKLIKEMKELMTTLKVKNFIFRDPVFSIDRKHTIKLCEEIIKEKLNVNICIETHLKNVDNELAEILKNAGVKLIYVGIESSDENVRNNSKRTSEKNLNQIDKINYLESLGIKVKTMYILGLPTDTKESFLNTLDYAKKINSTYAQFSVFTPYPGTPVFQEFKNKITAKKFEDFTQWQLVFQHPNFTNLDISNLLSKAYNNYYLRPKWIIKYLRDKIF